jgi:hypothetical protein
VFELIQPFLAPPVLPATVLLLLLIAWSLFTISVGAGLDFHHGHGGLHLDDPLSNLGHVDVPVGGGDSHSMVEALGDTLGAIILTPLKWLNLRSVPLFLWLGIFSICWWSVSIAWWMFLDEWMVPNLGLFTVPPLIVRNFTIGLAATKLITQPMRNWFVVTPGLSSKSLIGAEAEICSYDATPENGQAKYKTGASPLLLNVRTDGPHLAKGTKVWITHFDSRRRIYIVSPTTTTNSIDDPTHNRSENRHSS